MVPEQSKKRISRNNQAQRTCTTCTKHRTCLPTYNKSRTQPQSNGLFFKRRIQRLEHKRRILFNISLLSSTTSQKWLRKQKPRMHNSSNRTLNRTKENNTRTKIHRCTQTV